MSSDAHYTLVITAELHLLFSDSDLVIHEKGPEQESVFYNSHTMVHVPVTYDFPSNNMEQTWLKFRKGM